MVLRGAISKCLEKNPAKLFEAQSKEFLLEKDQRIRPHQALWIIPQHFSRPHSPLHLQHPKKHTPSKRSSFSGRRPPGAWVRVFEILQHLAELRRGLTDLRRKERFILLEGWKVREKRMKLLSMTILGMVKTCGDHPGKKCKRTQ